MINLSKYKWLLFDLDNTLLDFAHSSHYSFFDLCRHIGIEESEENYNTYDKVNKKTWKQYERGEITSQQLKLLRFEYFYAKIGINRNPQEAHELYISGLIKHSKVDLKVRNLLDRLTSTHKLGIITNGFEETQRARLNHTDLDIFFEAIIVSDEIGFAKPQKEYFDYVVENIEHNDRSELLIIGDSLMSDILGGMNSGIDTVWFNENGGELHSKVKPTYIIQDLQELIAV